MAVDASFPTTKVAKSSGRGSKPGERRGGRVAGTPNKVTREVKVFAQKYGPAAIEAAARLAGLVSDDDGKQTGMAESEQARLTAINTILDRAYGKATQTIAGDPENPIEHVGRIVFEIRRPK